MNVSVNFVGQKLHLATNLKNYVDGSQKFVRFTFNFADDSWNDMITIAQFQQNGNAYNVYLDSDNSAYLPTEITEGKCTLLLFGSKTEVKATTSYIELFIDGNRIVQDAKAAKLTETDYTKLVNDVSNKILFAENISNKDCDTLTGRLYVAYGNSVTNRPAGAGNGYFINIPHPSESQLYNKQFWIVRSNNKIYTRYQENGEFSEWLDISVEGKENAENKTSTLSSSSTDTQYPTAKAVWDLISVKEDKSNKITALGNNPTDTQYPSAKLVKTITDGLLNVTTVNITDTSCNNYSGKLMFAYGNNVSDKPSSAANGYLINIPHSIQPTKYNKQFWINRTGGSMFVREMEDGTWSGWTTFGGSGGSSGGDVSNKEDISNKITEFGDNPTDTQYPSAKLVYDYLTSLNEEDESMQGNISDLTTLITNKIAPLDTFPTSSDAMLTASLMTLIFIYTGETSGTAIRGHIYKIKSNKSSSSVTHEVVDIGSTASSSPVATTAKTWVALGDSKTDFNNNGVSRPDNYPYWIQLANPKITLQNLGSAGGMITNERVATAGSSTILYPSIYTKATQITGTPDIITVAGGFNDWNWCVPLGVFTTDISGYNTSASANVPSSGVTYPLKNTFYMGVFRLAKYLTERFPTTPILWITPFPTTANSNGGENGHNVNLPLSDYVQAIKDVCAYFSIPVCDMYNAGGLTPFTSTNLNTYWRSADGIHPNGQGSKIYSNKIARMMCQTYEDWGKTW